MASIVRYRDGWRAYLTTPTGRRTKTFRLRSEAEAWSRQFGKGETFAAIAEQFLAIKLPTLDSAANQQVYEQSIRKHVLPVIGETAVANLTRRQLVALVADVAKTGKVETAHRVGQRIRAILDYAVDAGEIESHPGAGLSRVLPKTSRRAMLAVPPGQFPQLLRDIATYPEPVTRIGLQLLAHTFVRTSELIGARWDEIKGDLWVIPEERMKRRLTHVVPISPHVRKLLDQLQPMTDDSEHWLASPRNHRVPISNNTLLFALYRLGYRGQMTGHGFRVLASSILNESGLWGRDAIERQLAHKESDDVRAAYHRASYLDERTRMVGWYSDHLAKLAASAVT